VFGCAKFYKGKNACFGPYNMFGKYSLMNLWQPYSFFFFMIFQTQPYLFNLIPYFSRDYFAINFRFPTFIFTPLYLIFKIVTYMLGVFSILNKLVSFHKKKTSFVFVFKYNFILNCKWVNSWIFRAYFIYKNKNFIFIIL